MTKSLFLPERSISNRTHSAITKEKEQIEFRNQQRDSYMLPASSNSADVESLLFEAAPINEVIELADKIKKDKPKNTLTLSVTFSLVWAM